MAKEYEMVGHMSIETEAEKPKERSHLLVDNNDSLIFVMKNKKRDDPLATDRTNKKNEEPNKNIMSDCSELNVSEE